MGGKVKGYGSKVRGKVNVYGRKGERIWEQSPLKVKGYGGTGEVRLKH